MLRMAFIIMIAFLPEASWAERCPAFFLETLRKKEPEAPILLCEKVGTSKASYVLVVQDFKQSNLGRRQITASVYSDLMNFDGKAGPKQFFTEMGENLAPFDLDGQQQTLAMKDVNGDGTPELLLNIQLLMGETAFYALRFDPNRNKIQSLTSFSTTQGKLDFVPGRLDVTPRVESKKGLLTTSTYDSRRLVYRFPSWLKVARSSKLRK